MIMLKLSKITQFAALVAAIICDFALAQERPTHSFDRQWLLNRAKTLASEPFVPVILADDSPLASMTYDDYKKIQFERGATIWSKEDRPFRLIPLVPGFLFKTPVNLNLVVGGVARRILYNPKIFDFDSTSSDLAKAQPGGYSGITLLHPINRPDKWDEVMVFQGGTYFRALGKNNWYGLSARGLAINTARPQGEEFPVFTDFYIEKPRPNANSMVVHAIMQSQSATGAFSFSIIPGERTFVDVNSVIYPRQDITHYGIAPLTSMILFNAMARNRFDDVRPAVHDSDGLLYITANGERVWRPLNNPKRLAVSAFAAEGFKGFGLLQRHRQFTDFQDIEAHYHDRPSTWVIPTNDWGKGAVHLIEIPTDKEIHDNIVAFFQPEQVMQAGQAYQFDYRMIFGASVAADDLPGRIVHSASGLALNEEERREFFIDYQAESFPPDLEVVASASTGNITHTLVTYVEEIGRLRVYIKFAPGQAELSELRVALQQQGKQWGESWVYRWTD